MAEIVHPRLDFSHPAPLRHRVSGVSLWFTLVGAGLAWLLQLLVGFAFSSYLCFTDLPRPPMAGVPGFMAPLLVITNLLTLAVAVFAITLGVRLIRRTREEHEDQPGGLLDAGEGRTRFLAVWGLMSSALFAIAIAFNTINLVLVPQCGA